MSFYKSVCSTKNSSRIIKDRKRALRPDAQASSWREQSPYSLARSTSGKKLRVLPIFRSSGPNGGQKHWRQVRSLDLRVSLTGAIAPFLSMDSHYIALSLSLLVLALPKLRRLLSLSWVGLELYRKQRRCRYCELDPSPSESSFIWVLSFDCLRVPPEGAWIDR